MPSGKDIRSQFKQNLIDSKEAKRNSKQNDTFSLNGDPKLKQQPENKAKEQLGIKNDTNPSHRQSNFSTNNLDGRGAVRPPSGGLKSSAVRQTSSVLEAATNKASTPTGASIKIDSDLLNVANENRVILNVGGIRHETYRVS